MADRQAFGIDINEYSRMGGVDYSLVSRHLQAGVYDFLITKAGLGTARSPLLDEHRQKFSKFRIPSATYHLVDPRSDMRNQARCYVDWVGTQETAYIVDIERPNRTTRLPTRSEMLQYIDELMRLTKKKPILYSSVTILKEVGFIEDAKQFDLWIAQYMYDMAKLPNTKAPYQYFHDFMRDYAGKLPPTVRSVGLEKNTILWQFTDSGNGPHYVYSLQTADPRFPVGMKEADLNVSIQGRSQFMKSVFGTDVPPEEIGDGQQQPSQPGQPARPSGGVPYPGMTNQEMINLIFKAAKPFTNDPWTDWIVPAGLTFMAVPDSNRQKEYSGPPVQDFPNTSDAKKIAILALMDPQVHFGPAEPTYPDLTNQGMINLIYSAARVYTNNPLEDWIIPAGLLSLMIPEENRANVYTGPRVEDLPHLTAEQKKAILDLM